MTLKDFLEMMRIPVLFDLVLVIVLVYFGVSFWQMAIGLVVIIAAGVLIFQYDGQRYPICPKCNHNLNTIRPELARGGVKCSVHGQFLDAG